MPVEVRLYSILREAVGRDSVTLDLPGEARVSDVIEELRRLAGEKRNLVDAVADDILVLDEKGRRLSPTDRVPEGRIHVMPPPEGGEGCADTGILSPEDEVDLDKLVSKAIECSRGAAGAIAVFVGSVRNHNMGRQVTGLYYEVAEELAKGILEKITRETIEKYRLYYAAAYHYKGPRRIGEKTMIVLVAGDSRKNAYPALEELVDRIKREVPIWKQEYYADGTRAYILGGRRIEPNP